MNESLPRSQPPKVVLIASHEQGDPLEAFGEERRRFDWNADPAVLDFTEVPRGKAGPDLDRVIRLLAAVSAVSVVSLVLVLAVLEHRSRPALTIAPRPSSGLVTDLDLPARPVYDASAAPVVTPRVEPVVEPPARRVSPIVPARSAARAVETPKLTVASPAIREPVVTAVEPPPEALTGSSTPSAIPRLPESRTPPAPVAPPVDTAAAIRTTAAAAAAAPTGTTGATRDPALSSPAGSPTPDQSAIRSLVGRYRTAFSSLDVAAVADVWPTLDRRALDRAFSQLFEQRFDFLGCEISVNGSIGLAQCFGQAHFVPKVGNRRPRLEARQWDFTLRRASSDWIIETVQSR